ncbi:MAG TPA: DoxX family protein [Candidatus Angelobacter sp.]|jgi:hypothetical protein|nr:DoxX family protein [Candidatus Angelobacter sp.]
MQPQLQTEPISQPQQIADWSPALRIAFRFSVAYLGLFCVATQIITSLFSATQGTDIPDPGTLWPLRPLVMWTAAHIFHVTAPLSLQGNSASGDCMFGWVLAFCLLVIAAFATVIWSVLDRKRTNYTALHRWVRLFLRFALAGQMINYGMAKVIPLQMPYPSLTRLLQPFGTFSPMGVLWSSIGAAPAYEIFAGCAEVLGGVLLIVPRTATLGALICLADMIQVFMLNMTYDVPVKLFAFHLILLACFLLAPDVPRLARVLFTDRATAPLRRAQLFSSTRANRIALVAQVVLGLWLLGLNLHTSRQFWSQFGGGRQYSALYGIWEVTEMQIDGQPRPPLLTDDARWRRAIFDYPRLVALQRMDDSLAYYRAAINITDKTLVLTKGADKNWRANLSFQRPVQNRLVVDGRIEDHQVHIELQLEDRNKFLLVNRGFHWIQESSFNR